MGLYFKIIYIYKEKTKKQKIRKKNKETKKLQAKAATKIPVM